MILEISEKLEMLKREEAVDANKADENEQNMEVPILCFESFGV